METSRSFETLVPYHITSLRHNPERGDLTLRRRENLISSITSLKHWTSGLSWSPYMTL